MIKALIFDMDGVIIDSEPVYLEIQLEFARRKNPNVKPEDLFDMVGATKQHSWSVMQSAIQNGQTWQELRAEFKTWEMSERVDYQAIFRPQMRHILEVIKQKGYLLAVASSTQLDLVTKIMEINGIIDYFEILVSGDQFTLSKPDPEIYHYTASRLGVAEAECLVVEDSTFGILAASRAGMTIAAVKDSRFPFDQSLADYRMEDVEEVLDILEELAI